MFVGLHLSADGVTFPSGATDYVYGGSVLYAGSGASPSQVVPITAAYIALCSQTDQVNTPVMFDAEISVSKVVLSHNKPVRSRAWLYNSAAAQSFTEYFYSGYSNVSVLNNAMSFAAFKLYPGTGSWAADTEITVEWVY
jgi:hypothetical protein